jgi:hypothetical protein
LARARHAACCSSLDLASENLVTSPRADLRRDLRFQTRVKRPGLLSRTQPWCVAASRSAVASRSNPERGRARDSSTLGELVARNYSRF